MDSGWKHVQNYQCWIYSYFIKSNALILLKVGIIQMSILNLDKCSYYSSAVINNFEQVWIRLVVEYRWRPIFINYMSAIQLILKLSQAYVDNEKVY